VRLVRAPPSGTLAMGTFPTGMAFRRRLAIAIAVRRRAVGGKETISVVCVRHLIEGTASPQEVAELARGRWRSKRAELALARKTPSP
jgi:hypothetical protein